MRAIPPLLWLLLASPVAAAEAPLEPGAPLPPLKGEFLTGRQATLPEAARGRVALVIMGFTYDSRFQVEAWAKQFREAYGTRDDLTFFEVPMMGNLAWAGKPFIDSGMRKSTPQELHEHVMTVWGSNSGWKKRVGFKGPNDAYLTLIDAEGRVAWRHAGAHEAAAWDSLAANVAQLTGR
jgi:hypothetical protein